MFDEILSIEDENQEKGRLDGFKNGQIQALKDACQFGMRNGFAISKEVAYAKQYSTLLQQRLQRGPSNESTPIKSPFVGRERLEKLLSEIFELAESFSLLNNMDQNLEHLVKSIRQKLKLAQALYNSSGGKEPSSVNDLSF